MRIAVLLLVLPLLAGCTDTDWNHLFSFGGADQSYDTVAAAAPAAAAPAPAPAPAAPNAFCLGVARQDATSNDFDEATQKMIHADAVRATGGQVFMRPASPDRRSRP